jgi:hypothetical protein
MSLIDIKKWEQLSYPHFSNQHNKKLLSNILNHFGI